MLLFLMAVTGSGDRGTIIFLVLLISIYFIYLFIDLAATTGHSWGSIAEACGIRFLDQGLNEGPLHWEGGVLATGPPGKFLEALNVLIHSKQEHVTCA